MGLRASAKTVSVNGLLIEPSLFFENMGFYINSVAAELTIFSKVYVNFEAVSRPAYLAIFNFFSSIYSFIWNRQLYLEG